MASVFVKRYPSKGELPTKVNEYITNNGLRNCYCGVFEDANTDTIDYEVEWWLEEVELPSEGEMNKLKPQDESLVGVYDSGFYTGANFILNKLKGE